MTKEQIARASNCVLIERESNLLRELLSLKSTEADKNLANDELDLIHEEMERRDSWEPPEDTPALENPQDWER
jgi:hypothetical protein